jgi:hypothetical protein
MGCCGKNRERYVTRVQRGTGEPEQQGDGVRRLRAKAPVTVVFQYVGRTGLTVRGPFSGKRYRFDFHGARVAIDARDAASMAAVPNLEKVKKVKS